jgi:UDP-N-acetylglucosamine diphosphorylase/glucosamine-1-phosphate N-acetyltransferase
VGELLHGCLTLRERAEHVFGAPCLGHVSRTALLGFDEPGAATAIPLDEVAEGGTRILLSSRAVVEFQPVALPTEPTSIFVDGSLAGWIVPDGGALPSELWLRDPSAAPVEGPRLDLDGYILGHPWDLIARNDDRITADVARLWPGGDSPEGVYVVGDHEVSLGTGSVIEPGVHLDVRDGPIRLSAGVRVEGPARLTGPLFVGPGSTIFGGSVGTSSIGPVCLVRGEVAHSVFLGFVNKAHDGHIGHAFLGRWVNLGAFTTNSDLKNNYRSVRVWTPEGDKDSGLIKVGCFLGDHVKTGIGTILNTGCVIGAGSNVFGGIMPPTTVPPFSWGAGGDLRDHRLEKFLETAERVMERRGQTLTPGVTTVLERAWTETAGRRAQ